MTLTAGTLLGRYEIDERIGVGGMGEVYRAHDRQLGRFVALKILPQDRHPEPEAVLRFEREARLLASLNHPNVATVHGLETDGPMQAIVMELIDGETLGERIERTPKGLPLSEAIDIARQIATALDAAHEAGVIHRDLKPANIKIRPDGTVKVLDFGVARTLVAKAGPGAIETVTKTQGAVAGTPSYMSPEQASGGAVDRRTDIWALGCVLFEMLTGQRAFEGDTDSRIIARVLERDPDWRFLPRAVPSRVRLLLRQCLEKDPRRRRRDAGDLRLELELAASGSSHDEAAPASARAGPALLIAAATAVVVLAGGAALYGNLSGQAPPRTTLEVSTPASRAPHHFAISPDGRHLAYVASAAPTGTLRRLYVRDLESGETRPVPATDGARYPFWSPDSRSIGYFDREYLYSVEISGGAPRRLAPAQNALGGSWGADDTIVYAPNSVSPLFQVTASGGRSTALTTLDPLESNHRFPAFLPDGRRFLFYVDNSDSSQSGIHLGSLDGEPPVRLAFGTSAAVFVAPDWAVFGQDGALVARRIDFARGTLAGDPVTLAAELRPLSTNFLPFSASTNGILAYRNEEEPRIGLTWYDGAGNVLAREEAQNGPELSTDDRLLAFDGGTANRDVYVRDLERGDRVRVTTSATVEGYPVLSPYSREVIYEKQRSADGIFELWIAPLNRPGEERRLYGTPQNLIPLDWSVGQSLLYRQSDIDFLASDLMALPLSTDNPTPLVVAGTDYEERLGSFSPDGNWVAYDTNRSGRFEIVVQSYPVPGDVFPVSADGGMAPIWSADGTEIFFIAPDGTMMSARARIAGTEFEADRPAALFATQIVDQPYNHQYAVTADRRFLVLDLAVDEFPTPITVIQNLDL